MPKRTRSTCGGCTSTHSGPRKAFVAIEMYRGAIDIDPDYANAHVGFAIAHSDVARSVQAKVPDNWAAAEAAAKRALELDSSLGAAHMVLAFERLLWAWDFDAAYERLQKALSLSPGSAEIRLVYSTYLMLVGEFDRAIEEVDAAGQLDPLSLPVLLARCDARLNAGRGAEAIEIANRILEQDPSFRAAIHRRGIAMAIEGRLEEAHGGRSSFLATEAEPGIAGEGAVAQSYRLIPAPANA